MFQGVQPY